MYTILGKYCHYLDSDLTTLTFHCAKILNRPQCRDFIISFLKEGRWERWKGDR